MTPTELIAIRKRLGHTQASFSRALGYEDDGRGYRRYENGTRPIPPLLAIVARLLDERGSCPEWM